MTEVRGQKTDDVSWEGRKVRGLEGGKLRSQDNKNLRRWKNAQGREHGAERRGHGI